MSRIEENKSEDTVMITSYNVNFFESELFKKQYQDLNENNDDLEEVDSETKTTKNQNTNFKKQKILDAS